MHLQFFGASGCFAKQFVIRRQEDRRSAALCTSKMKRIEPWEPQSFQLLCPNKLELSNNDPAMGSRSQYLYATSTFRIGCLADFKGNRFAGDPFPLFGITCSQDV